MAHVQKMTPDELATEREDARAALLRGVPGSLRRFAEACAEPARRSARWTPEWAMRRRLAGLDEGAGSCPSSAIE